METFDAILIIPKPHKIIKGLEIGNCTSLPYYEFNSVRSKLPYESVREISDARGKRE